MTSEAGWQKLTLEQAGVTLIDCDHRTPPAVEEGYPYIAIPQLRDGHIRLEGARRISSANFIEWTKKLRPMVDDVIVVRRCSSGDSAVVPSGLECAIGQNLVVLRADGSRIYPPFLRWLVRGPEWWEQVSKYINVGAVFDSLKCREIPSFALTIPPLVEQREIARVLAALDDRIELLRETNDTLEAIAKALFKSWFVDFDPVHAKQQGLEPLGIDESTAALFPTEFEDSPLGLIPSGWMAGTLENLSSLNPESWTAKKHPQHVAYLDLANTKNNEITEIVEYSFDAAPSRARRVLRDRDTIIGTVRPGNRSFAFIQNAAANLTGSTGFAVLRPAHVSYAEFLYLAATQNSSIDHLAHVADGGAYPAVRPEVVLGLPCVIPNTPVMEAFHGVVAPLLIKAASNQITASALADLRDTLLPRLISGQLRLPKADSNTVNALLEETIA